MQAILDRLPQMVWANEGGVQYYSGRWREFTGIDLLADDIDRLLLIHDEDRDGAAKAWDEAQRTGAYEHEYRLRHHSGEFRWIVSHGTPVRDAAGAISGWYGACTDIHEKKLLRQALQANEALNRSILDASVDPILVLGLDRTILYVNEAGCEHIGAPLEAVRGSSLDRFSAFSSPEGRQAFQAAANGQRGRVSAEYHGVTGARHWDVSLAPMATEGGEQIGILAVCRDVTEAKRAAAKVEELQSQIVHVARLSAMGTMAATLAHELNQPLTAAANYIRGGARFLKTSDAGPEMVGGAFDEAERQILRAGRIIKRARDMMREGDGHASDVSLSGLVQNALRLCGPMLRDLSVSFESDIPAEVDLIHVDPVQTEQVIGTIVQNAVEAMAGCEERRLTVTARPDGSSVRVEVADTGIGIKEGDEERIFNAVQEDAPGRGLGLAITRTILERQGGTISASNNDKGGASFVFTVPAAHPRLDRELLWEVNA